MKFDSLVIHGGIDGDKNTGAVTVPIYQTSTYAQKSIGVHTGYEYSRTGNPTREALEKLISELEGGYKGFAFGSGMAAISSVLMMFNKGDHIIFSNDVYGGTFRVVDKIFKNFGFEYDFIDTSNEENIINTIKENTKAIYIETPTNPLMKMADIEQVSKIARENNLLVIVDNTFMTPYLQKPIELGADIVLHSATKYLGGHSDLIAGVVVVNSDVLAEKMHFVQNSVGAILGPFDSWLLIKGIKTLSVRMERHCKSAEEIAKWLSQQQWVEKVYYPGLDYKGKKLKKQGKIRGYGGMISFEVNDVKYVDEIMSKLNTITLAESLGGVESLISVPAKMTHASIPSDKRDELGITDKLIRLSVGIEDIEDIINDLDIASK